MSIANKFERRAFEYTPNPRRRKGDRKGEPARIDTLPKVGQKLWVESYDKALKRYKDKGISAAIAWATVKKSCAKDYQGFWECPSLVEKAELKKRAKKLRSEAAKARKREATGTETGERHKRQRIIEPVKLSDEELLRRVGKLRE